MEKNRKQAHKIAGKRHLSPVKRLLAGLAAAAMLSHAGDLSPARLSSYKAEQKTLQLVRQAADQCYDRQHKLWTDQIQISECGDTLKTMFDGLGRIASIRFSGNFVQDASKLRDYFEQHGHYFSATEQPHKGQPFYNFALARITKTSKEKLRMREGETEFHVVYLDKPVVSGFIEEKLSTPDVKMTNPEAAAEGKIYIRTDDSTGYVDYLLGVYKNPAYRRMLSAFDKLRFPQSDNDALELYKETAFMLRAFEWEDFYNAVNGNRAKFSSGFVDAHIANFKYHGARHILDRYKFTPYEGEERAKQEEFWALRMLPNDYMVQGHELLGSTIMGITSHSAQHVYAANSMLNCFVNIIDHNRGNFPAIVYPVEKDRMANAALQQMHKLTGPQIQEIADACYHAKYGSR